MSARRLEGERRRDAMCAAKSVLPAGDGFMQATPPRITKSSTDIVELPKQRVANSMIQFVKDRIWATNE
jgi:hypothetical protein